MAPSAAAFGPATRQSAVSACWLRGVRGEPGARGRCPSGGQRRGGRPASRAARHGGSGLSPGGPLVRRSGDNPPHQEAQMKYAMLIYEKPGYIEALSEDEQKAVLTEYTA